MCRGLLPVSPTRVLAGLYRLWAHRFLCQLHQKRLTVNRKLPHCQPARGELSQQPGFSRVCSWSVSSEALEQVFVWCKLSALPELCQNCSAWEAVGPGTWTSPMHLGLLWVQRWLAQPLERPPHSSYFSFRKVSLWFMPLEETAWLQGRNRSSPFSSSSGFLSRKVAGSFSIQWGGWLSSCQAGAVDTAWDQAQALLLLTPPTSTIRLNITNAVVRNKWSLPLLY